MATPARKLLSPLLLDEVPLGLEQRLRRQIFGLDQKLN